MPNISSDLEIAISTDIDLDAILVDVVEDSATDEQIEARLDLALARDLESLRAYFVPARSEDLVKRPTV